MRPPEPVASARPGAEPPRPVMPSFKPWVPGQAKESSVAGVKLTMPAGSASQLPPWEINPTAPEPFHEAQPAPIPAPPEDAEADEEHVRTPDLPLPPEIREEAVPVGDETVLVPEDTLDLGDSLELEAIVPPPEPEVPLQSRRTTRSAVPRAVVTPIWGPPVADEPDEEEQKFAILTEDDTEAPVVGEDTDSHYIVVSPSRRGATSAPSAVLQERSAAPRSSAMLLGMAAVALVATAIVLYLVFSGGSSSTSGEGRASSVGESASASLNGEASAGQPLERSGAPSGSGGANPAQVGGGVTAPEAVAPGSPAAGAVPSAAPGDAASQPGGAASGSASGPSSQPVPPASLSVATPVPAAPPAPVPAATPSTAPAAATVRDTSPVITAPPAAKPTPAPAAVAKVPPPAAEVKAATARLSVESIPAGATLILDGQSTGTTPKTITTSLGRHTIRLTRDGFSAAETVVTLDSAEPRKISMSLERSSPGAGLILLITSNEIGADVYVDNNRAGAAPLTLTLLPGKHSVKVAPQGKPEKEETVNVAGDLPPNQRERKHFQF